MRMVDLITSNIWQLERLDAFSYRILTPIENYTLEDLHPACPKRRSRTLKLQPRHPLQHRLRPPRIGPRSALSFQQKISLLRHWHRTKYTWSEISSPARYARPTLPSSPRCPWQRLLENPRRMRQCEWMTGSRFKMRVSRKCFGVEQRWGTLWQRALERTLMTRTTMTENFHHQRSWHFAHKKSGEESLWAWILISVSIAIRQVNSLHNIVSRASIFHVDSLFVCYSVTS